MAYCKNCGAELEKRDVFCPRCGAPTTRCPLNGRATGLQGGCLGKGAG